MLWPERKQERLYWWGWSAHGQCGAKADRVAVARHDEMGPGLRQAPVGCCWVLAELLGVDVVPHALDGR